MELINLTPHAITFVDGDGNGNLVVNPSGTIARVACRTEQTGVINVNGNEIPLTATVYGEVENLPAPEEDTFYLVSSLVAARVPERDDVFIPNESVRDSEGRIVGCKFLGKV